MNNKGVANIIAIVLLLMLVFGVSTSYVLTTEQPVSDMKSSAEESEQEQTESMLSSFQIINITVDYTDVNSSPNVTIKNNGKVDLDTSEFSIYLDGNRYDLVPYGTDDYVGPGEKFTFRIKG